MEKSIHSSEYAVFLRILRDVRVRAGVTQVDLAHHIGETQSFISKVERGERRVDLVELRAMCAVFGMSLTEFAQVFEAEVSKPKRAQPRRKTLKSGR